MAVILNDQHVQCFLVVRIYNQTSESFVQISSYITDQMYQNVSLGDVTLSLST